MVNLLLDESLIGFFVSGGRPTQSNGGYLSGIENSKVDETGMRLEI